MLKVITLLVVLLLPALAVPQGIIVRRAVHPPPAGAQGIVFNGTTQGGKVMLPNAAPFTSAGGFQVAFRVRSSNASGNVLLRIGGALDVTDIGSGIYAVDDKRDSVGNLHNTTGAAGADQVFLIQYDPSNSRWVSESWAPDCSGYAVETFSITTTSNFNLGGQGLYVCQNAFDTVTAGARFDWLRWIARVQAPSSGNCPGASPPAGVTWYGDWEFEGNANDSQAVAGGLTLQGSPAYENTP